MSSRYYVGFRFAHLMGERKYATVFLSPTVPTEKTHGHLYGAVVGPFRSKRGAEIMVENPMLQTVAECEAKARREKKQCSSRFHETTEAFCFHCA